MTDYVTNADSGAEEVPWLSVVMPIYNGEHYLTAALESIVAQGDDLRGIEVVAVDDGSTDRSGSILEEFGRRLRMRIIRPGRLGNWVAATNHGLAACLGQWSCFLHQDDVWLPGRVAAVKRAITAHPKASLLVHPSWFINDDGRRVGVWRTPFGSRNRLVESRDLWERLLVQNSLAINAPVFRTSPVLETGGLDDSLTYTADWDLWLRIASRGPAVHCGTPLGAFRIHAGAQTAGCPAEEMRRQLEAVFDRHRGGHAGWPPATRSVEAVGRYSIEMNVALAGWFHGRWPPGASLAFGWLQLGPAGWRRYVRDSRIVNRVGARLRARLRSRTSRETGQRVATSTDASIDGTDRG